MKRWPYLVSFLLFIALCASAAYWVIQFMRPPARPVALPPPAAQSATPRAETAASLFGGQGEAAASTSNYQLKGVVMAGKLADSVVILSSDGKPAQAFRAGNEIAPGISIKEVHPRYIVMSEKGVTRRIELPKESRADVADSARREAPTRYTAPPPRSMPAAASAVSPPSPSMPAPAASSSGAAANPAATATTPGMPAAAVGSSTPSSAAMVASPAAQAQVSGAQGSATSGVIQNPGVAPARPGVPQALPGQTQPQ